MVNVPPENSKQTRPFMKNTKKFYKQHPNKSLSSSSNRHYFDDSMTSETTSHGNSGENSSQNQLVVETSPAIAIVAPTARNPTHSVNINHSHNCKAGTNLAPPQPQLATAVPPRTMHVQHHIHHIQPVQISTAISPGQIQATATTAQLAAHQATPWPVVEPAFHFGPGFEIHQSYCPTHSHTDQHIVLFHLSPGVAVSFQIAGGHKIIQGKSFTYYVRLLFILFHLYFMILLSIRT